MASSPIPSAVWRSRPARRARLHARRWLAVLSVTFAAFLSVTGQGLDHPDSWTIQPSTPALLADRMRPIRGAATSLGGILEATAPVQVAVAERATTNAAVDSVGVNIHLHYNGVLYYENFGLIKQRLTELGVRHYRDILTDTTWRPYYDRHNELGKAGIKGVFVVQAPNVPAEVLRQYPSRMSSAFEAYEEVNEYDRSGDKNWVGTLRDSLVRLHAVKEVPALARFPIVGPSMAFSDKVADLGDVSAYFDLGNLHNYFGGRNPGTAGWGLTDRTYASYDWHFRYARKYFGGKPIVTTETGYMNLASTRDSVPEEVSGKYMARLLRAVSEGDHTHLHLRTG